MRTLLKNVRLLDNVYNLEAADLLIDGERIASLSASEAEQILDLQGYTVLPGLVDTDLSCQNGDELSSRLLTAARNGVTSARCNQMQTTVPEGLPDVLYSYSVVHGSPDLDILISGKIKAGGIQLGHRLVKEVSMEELQNICRRCAQRGAWVTAHAKTLKELQTLTLCGITELLDIPTFPIPEYLIVRMVAKGICITLSASDSLSHVQRENLCKFHACGGMIAVSSGDGTLSVSGFQIIQLMEAGLSLQTAVKCATLCGAVILGTAAEDGSIMAGKFANLVIVHGDPAVDPSALTRIEYVVQKGKLWHVN